MPTNAPTNVVIAGGGLAGANAALELRKLGHTGRIVLVGEEPEAPYERPPLSKEYLRGEKPFEEALVKPADAYRGEGIELLTGRRVVTLDPAARTVNLDDGTDLAYDALVIATGSAPRPLRVPGGTLAGVHYLRTHADADALRAAADAAERIAVVGGGWIGSEVAASLRQLGRNVTLITSRENPLESVLGPEVAAVYRDAHERHGVHLVTGRVVALEGDDRVSAVWLSDGQTLPADLVVVGVGAAPRLHLAQRAGLEITAGGIATDECLRTSIPSIYAVGDVAAAWHPRYGRHVRVEHWDNAIRQGRAVAASILGAGQPYARIPYFYSDQFDLGMEYRGYAPAWGRVVLRGDVAARTFHAFWLADGRVLAAMNVNLWDDGKELRRLVESEARIDPDRLADATLPLAEAA